MDLDLKPYTINKRESLLRKAILKEKLIDQDKIDNLLLERDKASEDARKNIRGKCYAIDYLKKKLVILDTFSGEQINSINLPGFNPPDFKTGDWEEWGNSTLVMDNEELHKEGEIPFYRDEIYGLVLIDGKSYLYNPELNQQKNLGITRQFLFGAKPKRTRTYSPYDIFLSPDNNILCLSNRDEGKVFVFDTETDSFVSEMTVRMAGSNKAINMAISLVQNRIYVTDNSTPYLGIYDIGSRKYNKRVLGKEILGNIAISPFEDSVYILITNPESILKNIDLEYFEDIKTFPLKGELYSNSKSPADLLTLSPDKKNLFLMTYLNDPEPFSPVITVIDTEKNKAVKRFAIKDESRPINIVFKEPNPVGRVFKELGEMLIENELLDRVKLNKLKKVVEEELESGESTPDEVEEEKDDSLKVEQQEYSFEFRKEESSQQSSGGLVPKRVKHIIFSTKANKHISEVLLGSFWQKTNIDLSEHPKAMDKLNDVADNIRKKLEYYDIDIIDISAFHEGHSLTAMIQRAYVMEMLEDEESKSRQNVKAAPSNCPNCHAPLLGAWDCITCGFSLEKPEDALRRRSASLEYLSNLQSGNFFAIDSENGQLLEVDQFQVPVWKVSKDELGIDSITSAFRLENRNTIILDKVGGNIIEVSPKGKVEWKYSPLDSENGKLANPSAIAILNDNKILIADTDNHRILEIDTDCKILKKYGTPGESGINSGFLNKPLDIQKTYDDTYLITDSGNNRVIELSNELRIIWQYGNIEMEFAQGKGVGVNQLNNPVSAKKDTDNKYLVLDAGNKRAILLDQQKSIIWEYKTAHKELELSIENPEKITRLKNQDLLIYGNKKIIQIMTLQANQIKWCSLISKIAAKSHFSNEKKDKKPAMENKDLSNFFNKPKEDKKKVITKNIYMGKAHNTDAPVSDPADEQEELDFLTSGSGIKSAISKKDLSGISVEEQEELDFLLGHKKPPTSISPTKPDIRREASVPFSVARSNSPTVPEIKQIVTSSGDKDKPITMLTNDKQILNFPILMVDKTENKIFLLNRTGEYLWTYGNDKTEKLTKITSAFLTENKTVVVTEVDSVIEIDMRTRKKIWEYKCTSKYSNKLKNGNILITDQRYHRVIELTPEKNISWKIDETDKFNLPTYALRLPNGNTLITHSGTHFIKEVTPNNDTVWTFGTFKEAGHDNTHLSYPEYACKTREGNTLIADTKNSRIIEVSPNNKVVWEFSGSGANRLIYPIFAMRLKDGNTFIVEANNKKAIEVDKDGNLIWQLIMPGK